MSKSQEILDAIEQAIDNNWKIRPVKGHAFLNRDYVKDTRLDDEELCLMSIEELGHYPKGMTGVALASPLHEGFVCLDLDFKDEDLKREIWALLSQYNKEELFLRIGNPEKMGQFWFRSYDDVPFCSYKGIDIITTQKRCDCIGQYKAEENLFYEWPYKKFYEHEFDDLPIISEDLVKRIVDKVCEFYKTDQKQGTKQGRHDALMEIAQHGFNANKRVNDIMDDLYSSDAYKELMLERDANAEIASIMSWVAKNATKSFVKIEDSSQDKDDPMQIYDIPKRPPRVEKNSFFDMIYKEIRANQIIDNKAMAMVTTLAICSWLSTLTVRFKGVAPNLLLLLIAPSGSGKTTSSRAIKELVKIEKRLKRSFGGQDIRTDSAIFSQIQQSPVTFYFIDEATKLLKSAKNKNSHNANVGEILSQLYSDYKDTDPPMALAKLKNESYGVAIGAKVVAMMSSTESFWNVFDEDNFTQGLGRRLFIVNSMDIPLQKKGFKYRDNFFRPEVQKAIYMFFKGYLGNEELFESVDIKDYQIVQEISSKNGIKEVNYYKNCLKPKIQIELTCNAETQEYLDNQFIDECNAFKIKSAGSGSNIQQYIANSRSELILKLAIIYATCGKSMEADGSKETELSVKVNTVIDMKCIEWATQMFNYYIMGGSVEQLDSLFKKDVEIEKSKQIINEFMGKIEEKGIDEFKKSHQFVRNFFKKIGGASYRDRIFKEMSAKGLIEIDGDIDAYSCVIKVVR